MSSVPVWMHHSICKFVNQEGERVEGCMCQVTKSEVDIVEGEISHLADKDEDCPHTRGI